MAEPIQIDVETQYIPDQSDPDNLRFVFAYHITISNHGSDPVQLLSRYWRITDGNQQVQEVEGQGVIGEQPRIEPQQSYSYTSGTVLATEVGMMEGHYVMQTDSGERFQAPIKPFTLALPHALH